MKPSTCPICRCQFTKARPLQVVCGPSCAIEHARHLSDRKKARQAAQDRRQVREKLAAMETYPQLLKKAQAAFNAFIRARDSGKPCISCSVPLSGAQVGGAFDCGHYRSVGSSPHLRFHEDNAHGQCKHCNRHLSGNHVAYRLGLVERIGLQAVEALEANDTPSKPTRDQLQAMAKHYRAEARRLKGNT